MKGDACCTQSLKRAMKAMIVANISGKGDESERRSNLASITNVNAGGSSQTFCIICIYMEINLRAPDIRTISWNENHLGSKAKFDTT